MPNKIESIDIWDADREEKIVEDWIRKENLSSKLFDMHVAEFNKQDETLLAFSKLLLSEWREFRKTYAKNN